MSDTPIYDQLTREFAEAAAIEAAIRRHPAGKRRTSERRLRVLNESPVLYAVTGGA